MAYNPSPGRWAIGTNVSLWWVYQFGDDPAVLDVVAYRTPRPRLLTARKWRRCTRPTSGTLPVFAFVSILGDPL